MIQAAKATTQLFLLAAVCLPVFANIPRTPLVAEEPHPGLQALRTTSRPGPTLAISNTATGFQVCLYDSGIRPCCSGKERDAETGLDYFGARYFSGAQGRWTSPDAPFADQHTIDPQSWNLYAYVRNNPLRAIDPDGLKCVDTNNGPADDGTGGGCEAAGVDKKGRITPQQFTVTDSGQMFTEQGGITYLLMENGRRWPVAEKSMQDATAEMLNAVPAAKLGLAIGKVGLAVGPLAVVIGKDALQHILARHAANAAAQNVSKFAAGLSKDAVEGLINAALKNGVRTQGSKVAFYDLDLGVGIGTNQAGQATSTIRVLVDNASGKAITAYPK